MYYVKTRDSFLSGWGRSEGKDNILIFECEDFKQAEIVAENARNRTDQTEIEIHEIKPEFNEDLYYVQTKTIEEYPKWYKKGAF